MSESVEGITIPLLRRAVVLAMGARVDAKANDEQPGDRAGSLVSPD